MNNNKPTDQVDQIVVEVISNLKSSNIVTESKSDKSYPPPDIFEQRAQKILDARKKNISLSEWDGLPPKSNK